MSNTPLSMTPNQLNAHFLNEVMDATGIPGEMDAIALARNCAIVEMFHEFAPGNAIESMIACHCINLRCVLHIAMRDANNLNLEPTMLAKMRASAMSISKTLHLWLGKYESIRTRNEARAAGAPPRAAESPAPPVDDQQPVRSRAPVSEQAPPVAPQPPRSAVPLAPPRMAAPPVQGPPASGMKQALQGSVAMVPDPRPMERAPPRVAPPRL